MTNNPDRIDLPGRYSFRRVGLDWMLFNPDGDDISEESSLRAFAAALSVSSGRREGLLEAARIAERKVGGVLWWKSGSEIATEIRSAAALIKTGNSTS